MSRVKQIYNENIDERSKIYCSFADCNDCKGSFQGTNDIIFSIGYLNKTSCLYHFDGDD